MFVYHASAHRDQKKMLDALELELLMAVIHHVGACSWF